MIRGELADSKDSQPILRKEKNSHCGIANEKELSQEYMAIQDYSVKYWFSIKDIVECHDHLRPKGTGHYKKIIVSILIL